MRQLLQRRNWRNGSLASIMLATFCMAPVTWADEPSAGKKDDEDGFGKKLVNKMLDGREQDVMDRLFALMESATKQLDIEFDPGRKTQEIQQQILKELDAAIEAAAAQTRRSKMKPKSSGDKRKMQDPVAQKPKTGATEQTGNEGDQPNSSKGKVADTSGGGEDMEFDLRRGWGLLPDRERDEVIQGFGEEYLEAYREWIEKYYRALQEANE